MIENIGGTFGDFVTWGMTAWPAKRYALVIWDHGQGWRAPTATRIRPTPGAPAVRRSAAVDPRTGLPEGGQAPVRSVRPGYKLSSIDLHRLLDRLGAASSGGTKRLRDAALTARDATKAAILGAHAAATRQGRFGSKGLGIYFPKSRAAFEDRRR